MAEQSEKEQMYRAMIVSLAIGARHAKRIGSPEYAERKANSLRNTILKEISFPNWEFTEFTLDNDEIAKLFDSVFNYKF